MSINMSREGSGLGRKRTAKALAAGLLVAAMMTMCLVPASPARATDTFTVDQTVDTPDANVGDGDCDVSLVQRLASSAP